MYHEANSELGESVFDNILNVINKGVSVVEKNFESGFDIYTKIQQLQMVKKEQAAIRQQAEQIAAVRKAAVQRQMESVRLQQQRRSIPLMQRLGMGGSMIPIVLGIGGVGVVAMLLFKRKRR